MDQKLLSRTQSKNQHPKRSERVKNNKFNLNEKTSAHKIIKSQRLKKLLINSKNSQFLEEEETLEDRCSICLEQIKEKTKPKNCRHIYCQVCITSWTRFSNVCPLCKVEFQELQIFDKFGVISETLEVQKPIEKTYELEEWILDMADNCYVCNKNDNEYFLLLCDGCDYQLCHTYCCGLQNQIPENDWYCNQCNDQIEARNRVIEQNKKLQKLKQLSIEIIDCESEIESDSDFETDHTISQQSSINLNKKEPVDISKILKMKSDLYNQSEEDEDTECEGPLEKQSENKQKPQVKKIEKVLDIEDSIEDKLSIEKDQICQLLNPLQNNRSGNTNKKKCKNLIHLENKQITSQKRYQEKNGKPKNKQTKKNLSEEVNLDNLITCTKVKKQYKKKQNYNIAPIPLSQSQSKPKASPQLIQEKLPKKDLKHCSNENSYQKISQSTCFSSTQNNDSQKSHHQTQKQNTVAVQQLPKSGSLLNIKLPAFKTQAFGTRISINIIQDEEKLFQQKATNVNYKQQQFDEIAEELRQKEIEKYKRKQLIIKQMPKVQPIQKLNSLYEDEIPITADIDSEERMKIKDDFKRRREQKQKQKYEQQRAKLQSGININSSQIKQSINSTKKTAKSVCFKE
ncbi:UNKNOWN [Stylonychia lemnae]|uniref:Uncharacterized protein n=1 Tax=Stylonychia lemnae TaxID=5949 RepID=A0A078AWG6_STYLE|nr:UNKNOWN [Stylonychia lemnae]|eukprot:CDW85592.1 UNKNOWN [Stylonychia lemnae]